MKALKFILSALAFAAAAQMSPALDLDFKVDEETSITLGAKIEIRKTDTGVLASDLGEAKIEAKFKFDEVPLEKRLELAKQNDPESLVMLAWRYYLGVSVEKDFDRALEYCKQLQALGGHDLNSLRGNLEYKILVREVLKNGKDNAIVAAQSGDANAAYILARSYYEGKNGFEKNKGEAKLFLEIACGLGHKDACLSYADILLGEGKAEESMSYLKKAAADKTFLVAQAALALRMIDESKDPLEKEAYLAELKSAADKGLDFACAAVGNFYIEGKYFEKDEPLGVEYLKKAARQGDDRSIMNLVGYYESHSMRGEALELARKSYSFDSMPAVEYVCSALLSEEIESVQKEKESANAQLKERAEAGDLQAMADLAKVSSAGEALKLYKKIALKSADEFALRRIFEIWAADFDAEAEDPAEFEKFYKMAAGKKIFLACFVKGRLIESGFLKSASPTPLSLYRYGYKNGSGECACALWRMFEKKPKPTKEESAKALECLKFAASKGVPDALSIYGRMLLMGENGLVAVEKDEGQGAELLRRAAEGGSRAAAEILGEYCYKKGDKAECKKYLAKAVFLGSKKSMRDLGYVHLGEKNYKEAVRHFKSAMEFGDFSVAEILARMYLEGLGVDQSDETALAYFFIGARKGDAGCLFNYAAMLASSENPKIKDVDGGIKIARFLFPFYEKRRAGAARLLVKELTGQGAMPQEIYAYAKVAKNKGVQDEYLDSCVEYFENKVISDTSRAEFAAAVKNLESQFTDKSGTLKFQLPIVPAIAEYLRKAGGPDSAQNSDSAQ